jgi:mono/diheme cytochrome c family protein
MKEDAMIRMLGLALSLGLAGSMIFTIASGGAENASPANPPASQTSLQLAASAPKGSIKDPFLGNAQAIADGGKLYSGAGCPGCHGGGGGGGICPPLINGVWIYGDDPDTLFRLIALGSADLQKQGYSRMAIENVVAPMPSFGAIIPRPADILKIIAWIKSHYDANGKPLPGNQ